MADFYSAAPSIEQEIDSALQDDIATPVIANPEEQSQYTDLVSRVILAMSDSRVAKGMEDQGSPNGSFLKMARRPNLPLQEGIGMALGEVLKLVYGTGKRQGTEYDPDVMLGAIKDELPRAAYLMAEADGIIKDGPKSLKEGGTPVDSFGSLSEMAEGQPIMQRQLMETDAGEYHEMDSGGDDAFDYDFSQEELDFIEEISMEASRYFGTYLVQSGQLNQGAWQELMMGQMANEEQSGMAEGAAPLGEDTIAALQQQTNEKRARDPLDGPVGGF